MNQDRFDKLLAFLERLDAAKIHYSLSNYREEALSVEVHVPGEHWEIDFLADGDIEVERYRSSGHIDDASVLDELFAKYSDEETQTEESQDDAIARK
jgi:hypothetical protein